MLEMIEERAVKERAQALLVSLARKVWPKSQQRLVAWRPSSAELRIQHNDEYWFGHMEIGGGNETRRHWNSYGAYRPEGNLVISVEINIPIENNTRRVSGFFARDRSSGTIYLMHDGGVGGGRKGIGRDAFLEAISARPQRVATSADVRMGLIVAPLEERHFEAGLSGYLSKVIAFKAAVAEGRLMPRVHGLNDGIGYSDYFKEFSGNKSGGGNRFTYESRHGDVVHALVDWVRSNGIAGKIRKSVLVDLIVLHQDGLTALFEVKSSVDRQSLYTAIGQLMVHSAKTASVQRYLVIPQENIPNDIRNC